jgi:hypothetical protein
MDRDKHEKEAGAVGERGARTNGQSEHQVCEEYPLRRRLTFINHSCTASCESQTQLGSSASFAAAVAPP